MAIEAQELTAIKSSISVAMSGSAGQFRQAATAGAANMTKIVKDISNIFAAQRKDLAELTNVMNETLHEMEQTNSKFDNLERVFEESVSIQNAMQGELKNISKVMKNMTDSIYQLDRNIQSSLTSGPNSVLGGLTSVFTSGLGGVTGKLGEILLKVGVPIAAGAAGAAGYNYMTGGGAGADAGGKVSNPVMAKEMYNYLTKEKGVDHAHAIGILTNVEHESNFNSGAQPSKETMAKEGGPSGGLFQHHDNYSRGEHRFTDMVNASGGPGNWQKNWKAQVDFAMSEKDMQNYLKTPYSSGAAATEGFTRQFERPKDPNAGAERARHSGKFERLVSENNNPNQSTTNAATAVTPGSGEGGGSTNQNQKNTSGKDFLASRGGGSVHADKLDSGFAEKMAKAIQAAETATGSKVNITEGYRDPQTQAQYYSDYVGKPITYEGRTYQPNPAKLGRLAAPPGRSKHQKGLAVDISDGPAREWLIKNAPNFGIESLFAKIGKDKPHFQSPGHSGEEGMGPSLQEYSPSSQTSSMQNVPTSAAMPMTTPTAATQPSIAAQPAAEAVQTAAAPVAPPTTSQAQTTPTETAATPVSQEAVSPAVSPAASSVTTPGESGNIFESIGSMLESLIGSLLPTEAQAGQVQNAELLQSLQRSEATSASETIKQAAMQSQIPQESAASQSMTTPMASHSSLEGYNYQQPGYAYNYDVGWADWAARLGGNHWKEMQKYKESLTG